MPPGRVRLLFALLLPLSAAAAILPAPPMAPGGTFQWRAYRDFTSADGLPHNSVLALLQDADGFVYAGTEFGLSRYDGRGWTAVDLPAAGRSYAVGALAQADDGALWVGTDNAGAWRIAPNAEPQALALPRPVVQVNALLQAGDGRMWVATGRGLFRCAELRCERIEAIGETGARALFGEEGEDGARLWVGTDREGAVELAGLADPQPQRTGRAIGRAQGLPNDVALSITRHFGDLWIGSGRGLVRHDGRDVRVYDARIGFPGSMVFAMQPDVAPDGEAVLLATLWPGGIAEIRADGRWRLIDSRAGLPANATRSLLRERYRDDLWIGTVGAGVARVERGRWALFDERVGLPERSVLGVGWSAPNGPLWVGTTGGAVYWAGDRFDALLPGADAGLAVHDLLDAPDGLRWIAHAHGLQAWRGDDKVYDFNVDNSALPAVSAQRLALRRVAGSHELYAATGHGLARWTPADGLEHVTDLPDLAPGVRVHDFSVLPDPARPEVDRLWIATDGGLVLRDAYAWTRIDGGCLAGIGPFTVDAEPRANGARLWLAARGGLWRIDPDGACEEFPEARSLGALTHTHIVGDFLYVFGARGALRLRRDAPPSAQPDARYDPASGLGNPEITMSAVDGRGRLFGATASGLAALQPVAADHAQAPAPLRLLFAEYGRQRRPLVEGAALPPDDSSVHFEYSLLAFERQEATRYRTRLLGLKESFGDWEPAHATVYPRLPAGRYRFEVEARDADGVTTAPLSLGFRVAAYWWQDPALLAIAACLLLVGGLGIGRWRERVARRRAAALERQVAARTYELADANARLDHAATTDPLTGLHNRRYFERIAADEEQRARRLPASRALLVAMLDLDHFKRVNDGEGHNAGDAVLVEVARRLRALERGSDFALRWGGEEFLLLFRDVERDSADAPLLRVMDAVAREPVPWQGRGIRITASIGAIAFPLVPDATGGSLDQAICQADAALYRAKREGRDRAMLVALDGDGEPPCRAILREGAATP